MTARIQLNKDNLAYIMLESQENWSAKDRIVRIILARKERYERGGA